jgi:hypothetical protein
MGAHGRRPADYAVDWRFISLRMINSQIDYDTRFPAGYGEGHTSGLRLLRVAARARAEHGRDAVGPYYEAVSSEIFDSPGAAGLTPPSAAAVPSSSHCSPRPACPPGWPTRSTTRGGTMRSAPRATRRCR